MSLVLLRPTFYRLIGTADEKRHKLKSHRVQLNSFRVVEQNTLIRTGLAPGSFPVPVRGLVSHSFPSPLTSQLTGQKREERRKKSGEIDWEANYPRNHYFE